MGMLEKDGKKGLQDACPTLTLCLHSSCCSFSRESGGISSINLAQRAEATASAKIGSPLHPLVKRCLTFSADTCQDTCALQV